MGDFSILRNSPKCSCFAALIKPHTRRLSVIKIRIAEK
jgi:hypothetical protein